MSPKSIFSWAVYAEKDSDGYLNLKLQKADGRKKEIKSYLSLQEGKDALYRITSNYQLCQKLTGLYETKTYCFQHTISECDGACIGKITSEEYNLRVQNFIEKNLFDNKTLAIFVCNTMPSRASRAYASNFSLDTAHAVHSYASRL